MPVHVELLLFLTVALRFTVGFTIIYLAGTWWIRHLDGFFFSLLSFRCYKQYHKFLVHTFLFAHVGVDLVVYWSTWPNVWRGRYSGLALSRHTDRTSWNWSLCPALLMLVSFSKIRSLIQSLFKVLNSNPLLKVLIAHFGVLGAGDRVRKKTRQSLVLMAPALSRRSTPISQRFIFSRVGGNRNLLPPNSKPSQDRMSLDQHVSCDNP